jgi:t-SNARE complex subunit (syntaxin)
LFEGSKQLQNCLKDIQAKRDEILYLEKLINECLQLLEIIGVLVK